MIAFLSPQRLEQFSDSLLVEIDVPVVVGGVTISPGELVVADNDGVVDLDVDDPAGVNGLPFAGNFNDDATDGDEVHSLVDTAKEHPEWQSSASAEAEQRQ